LFDAGRVLEDWWIVGNGRFGACEEDQGSAEGHGGS
jgi:hypothetical protein